MHCVDWLLFVTGGSLSTVCVCVCVCVCVLVASVVRLVDGRTCRRKLINVQFFRSIRVQSFYHKE